MTHGSLFSGIGGFDLAATWAGWENLFQVEIDPWCQKILQKNFPHAKRFSDIRDFDGTAWKGAVDVISGGFPCQPYSTAGKRLGKEDERHLWPEMLRVIREAAPRWVVGENVFGLVSWSDGLVFEEVCADLEVAGYEVQPYILPAASVDAPHIRQRVWFVAHAASAYDRRNPSEFSRTGKIHAIAPAKRMQSINGHEFAIQRRRTGETEQVRMGGINVANANGKRLEKRQGVTGNNESQQQTSIRGNCIRATSNSNVIGLERSKNKTENKFPTDGNAWRKFPTQPPVRRGDDGIPNRVDRIRGLGNAVVPQVVYRIFDTINQCER